MNWLDANPIYLDLLCRTGHSSNHRAQGRDFFGSIWNPLELFHNCGRMWWNDGPRADDRSDSLVIEDEVHTQHPISVNRQKRAFAEYLQVVQLLAHTPDYSPGSPRFYGIARLFSHAAKCRQNMQQPIFGGELPTTWQMAPSGRTPPSD